MTELDKLEVLPSLTELSVFGNPVSITEFHAVSTPIRFCEWMGKDGIIIHVFLL